MKLVRRYTILILGITFLSIWGWKTLMVEPPGIHNPEKEKTAINLQDRTRAFWDYYSSATEFRTRGAYRQASEEYRQALQLKPSHKDALYYHGNVLLLLNEYAPANSTWLKLQQVNPKSSRVHSRLGYLYFCQDSNNPLFNIEKAEKHFQTAMDLNPEETGPMLNLAKLHIYNKNYSQAETNLAAIMATNFMSAEAHFYSGYLAWIQHNYAEASEYIIQARKFLSTEYRKKATSGEGATDSNSPMTITKKECDPFKDNAQSLLSRPDMDPQQIYNSFHQQINR